MSDAELELNSLDRFSKKSPRLVLEEHGSCEVPAGCGGVVLRWRCPADGMPVQLWVWTPGEVTLRIDGAVPSSARPTLSAGRHVLTLELSDLPPGGGALLFAGTSDPAVTANRSSGPPEAVVNVLSAPDGSWLYTSEEPDPGWTTLDAAPDWPALAAHGFSEPDFEGGRWAFGRCTDRGARGLGVARDEQGLWSRLTGKGSSAPTPTRLWVWKAFDVPGAAS